MELKVWVEGIQRIVCGVTEKTTCQVRSCLFFRTYTYTNMHYVRFIRNILPKCYMVLLVQIKLTCENMSHL